MREEVVITPVRRGRQARNAPVSSTIDPKTINLYFQSINTDVQYSTPEVLSIPDGTRIPTIEVHTVWKFLSTLKRTAPGPDELPFWIWIGGTSLINLRQQLPKYLTLLSRNSWSPACGSQLILHLFRKRLLLKQEIS